MFQNKYNNIDADSPRMKALKIINVNSGSGTKKPSMTKSLSASPIYPPNEPKPEPTIQELAEMKSKKIYQYFYNKYSM